MGVAVAVAVLWGGCGPEKIPPLQDDLGPAKRFRPFTVFHAGMTFAGLPMSSDGSYDVRDYHRGDPVTFSYGQCTPSGEHQNCNPPVVIANYPVCRFPVPKPSPRSTNIIRGVRVDVYYDYGVFDSVEIRTGKTAVVIHAEDPREALRIVRRLRAANTDLGVADRLPPPRRVTPKLSRALCG